MTARQTAPETAPTRRNESLTLGLILLAAGGLTLLGRLADTLDIGILPTVSLDVGILPVAGLVLMATAWLRRQSGFAVAGGIVFGIGLGALLVEGPFAGLSGNAEGGVCMLAFAIGWALISVVSGAIERRRVLWPLIPAGVVGLLGVGLLGVGGILEAFTLLGTVWPLALVAAGLWLLWRASHRRS
jgi:hypothetical protein